MPSSVTQRSAWMVTRYPIGDSGGRSKQVKSLVLVLFESTSVVNPGVRFYSTPAETACQNVGLHISDFR